MSMPLYASPEQFMRDRSEYARKGIGRGRSVVVTTYSGGVLFVAENHSPTLHKVSEIYDRIGFAGVGRYNEFENLRTAGIRLADVRGFSYDRKDVTGRWLANAFAQTLGSIFSEHQKPFEVEVCVAEVATVEESADEQGPRDQLYRISYDGSIVDESRYVVMGGATEPVLTSLKASFEAGWDLRTALAAAVTALGTTGENPPRSLIPAQLEVAVLDRSLPGRTFRRVAGTVLQELLEPAATPAGPAPVDPPAEPAEPTDPVEAGADIPVEPTGPAT
ncbi:proteasome subunit alpha [Nakamurella flavida]|uniref:Proteasome subunit alpha n=1 Tax=Nakamurella flavida TaxID=363630 RepID=A0A939C1U7_9ACTN|nr:proteasome subunit alpha [Nakamurella flavida]MDP9776961.1 proteasome alpha subunit [Nakamurella flavida]